MLACLSTSGSIYLQHKLSAEVHLCCAGTVHGEENGGTPGEKGEQEGWIGMRTVAQLRRELGVGAPRNTDSLYRPIERAPRKFNPLKIPKSLQVTQQLV